MSGQAFEDLSYVIWPEHEPLARTQRCLSFWLALEPSDVVSIREPLFDEYPHAFTDGEILLPLNPEDELDALTNLEVRPCILARD
jgi:hypothetical protein